MQGHVPIDYFRIMSVYGIERYTVILKNKQITD